MYPFPVVTTTGLVASNTQMHSFTGSADQGFNACFFSWKTFTRYILVVFLLLFQFLPDPSNLLPQSPPNFMLPFSASQKEKKKITKTKKYKKLKKLKSRETSTRSIRQKKTNQTQVKQKVHRNTVEFLLSSTYFFNSYQCCEIEWSSWNMLDTWSTLATILTHNTYFTKLKPRCQRARLLLKELMENVSPGFIQLLGAMHRCSWQLFCRQSQ